MHNNVLESTEKSMPTKLCNLFGGNRDKIKIFYSKSHPIGEPGGIGSGT